MLGLNFTSHPPTKSIMSKPYLSLSPISQTPKPHLYFPKIPSRFRVYSNNNPNNNLTPKEPKQEENQNESTANGDDDNSDTRKDKGAGVFFKNINWSDLVLTPDPDNVVAVALTGLLTWASVQVLWQLFFISFAILVAALKYSFIAALLIFILIALL